MNFQYKILTTNKNSILIITLVLKILKELLL